MHPDSCEGCPTHSSIYYLRRLWPRALLGHNVSLPAANLYSAPEARGLPERNQSPLPDSAAFPCGELAFAASSTRCNTDRIWSGSYLLANTWLCPAKRHSNTYLQFLRPSSCAANDEIRLRLARRLICSRRYCSLLPVLPAIWLAGPGRAFYWPFYVASFKLL